MLDPHRQSHFPFISELSTRGRSRLVSATRHVTLPPYTRVIEQGDEVAGVYLVETGALRIYYISSEGREGTLYWVDPGQSCILALNCLFARLVYPAWVETDQVETEVAIISGDVYRELYLAEPSLQRFRSRGSSVAWQGAARSDFRQDPSRSWTPRSSVVRSNRSTVLREGEWAAPSHDHLASETSSFLAASMVIERCFLKAGRTSFR